MQFLTPLFWLAAVAVSVPIFLHLTRREVRNPIPFASLMFLRKIPFQEVRRRKLKHLLLLALRCLGLLLLVAAFSHPIAVGSWLGRMNPAVASSTVILLDNSLSMSQQGAWESAQSVVEQRLLEMDEADEAMLIQFSESAEALTGWEKNPARLANRISSLTRPSYASTSYTEGLRLAVEQLQDASTSKRGIVLVSDLQSSGLSGSEDLKIPADVTVSIEEVGAETDNIYVEEVRLQRDVFGDTYPHSILVRLASSPPQESSGESRLYVGDILVDRQAFSLNEAGNGTITFRPFEVPEGVSRGKITLEVSDSLPVDDSFYFILERTEPFEVTLVSQRTPASTLYFENALSSGRNLPFQLAKSGRPDVPSVELSPVLVLDAMTQPPLDDQLSEYLRAGGGIIITLANSVEANSYNRRLDDILPAKLAERRYVRNRTNPYVAMTEASWEHPILSPFQDNLQTSLSEAQFYGYWKLDPHTDSMVLARFSNGDPALVERRIGEGTVLLFASSLDRVWSDFPLRSAYLPFWQQTIQYASRWQNRPAALTINQVLSLSDWEGTEEGQSRNWDVIDPEGSRVLALSEQNPEFVRLQTPGYYEIRANKGTDWVAVNTPTVESDLVRVPAEEFLAAVRRSQERGQQQAAAAGVQTEEPQQALWWMLLLLAAIVLAAESALANRLPAQRMVKQ